MHGGWHIADAVQRSYDVEGMHIGTIAAGRLGYDMFRKDASSRCTSSPF